MSASAALTAALNRLAAIGVFAPCAKDSERWLDPYDKVDVQVAREGCSQCLVREQCRRAALELAPSWGIWSGVDFGNPEARRIALDRPRGRRRAS